MSLFEQIHNRRNTRSVKWDLMEMIYEVKDASDILPMWVADMDFPLAPPIHAALQERLDHNIFGYSFVCDDCKTAIADWQKKRNDWEIETDWLMFHQGVIPAMSAVVETFSSPGDRVLVTPPVYPPFFALPANLGREVVHCELTEQDGHYTFDWEAFEEALQQVKLFIFCSPHNPGGRVWNEEELKKIVELCAKHDVLILSDEIHSDLVFKPNVHIPLAKVAGGEVDRIITCMAPTKTFNLAGIQAAFMVVTDPAKRVKLTNHGTAHGTGMLSAFGASALKAAYEEGAEWLDGLLEVLADNMAHVTNEFAEKLPQVRVIQPQATYLMWIDCRDLGMSEAEAMDRLLNKGKVALEPGSKYGEAGRGFLRINVAAPPELVKDGTERIIRALTD